MRFSIIGDDLAQNYFVVDPVNGTLTLSSSISDDTILIYKVSTLTMTIATTIATITTTTNTTDIRTITITIIV